MAIPPDIQQKIASELGLNILKSQSVGGGCIHNAQKLHSDQGPFFLKYNQLSQANNFETESRGLQLLAERGRLRTPKVIFQSLSTRHAFLLLSYIERGAQRKDSWIQLGEGLANLHQQSRESFGLDYDNYIGALPQSNKSHASWSDFFVQERLAPMLRMAQSKGYLQNANRQFELIYRQIDQLFPREAPALIHGDLWGGNLMTDQDGAPVLIDPSVHYAHREMELSFMRLFDAPPPAFYEAYQSVYPIADGWEERIDLCNLYSLLVHVNLFGGSYVSAVQAILHRFS